MINRNLTRSEKYDVLTRVIKHFEKQNGHGYNKNTYSCLYRAGNGNKCAVGCLIPKNKYNPNFEDNSITALSRAGDLKSDMEDAIGIALTEENTKFLAKVQHIHDSNAEHSKSVKETVADYRKLRRTYR